MFSELMLHEPVTETEKLLAQLSLVIDLNQDIQIDDLNFIAVFIKNGDYSYPLSIDTRAVSTRKVKDGHHQYICKFSYQLEEVRSFFQIFYTGKLNFVLKRSILDSAESKACINLVGHKHNTKVESALEGIYLTLDDTTDYMPADSLTHRIDVVNDRTI